MVLKLLGKAPSKQWPLLEVLLEHLEAVIVLADLSIELSLQISVHLFQLVYLPLHIDLDLYFLIELLLELLNLCLLRSLYWYRFILLDWLSSGYLSCGLNPDASDFVRLACFTQSAVVFLQ